MFCTREVPFYPELVVSVEENWEYLAFAWNTFLLLAIDPVLPSYKVLKGFTEIHYFRLDIEKEPKP